MKTQKYEAQLKKLLSNFTESCDQMAALARQFEIHPEHISYVKELTAARVRTLKKDLDFEHVKTDISLPTIDSGDNKKPDKSDKSEKDNKGSFPSSSEPSSPLGGGSPGQI
jgi:hypothetical protein